MRKTARDLIMRGPSKDGAADWCRFSNKTNADGKEIAVIHIYDEIGYWGTDASSFVRRLAGVTQDSIELHINSPGGEIFDGIAIYNALKSHPATVDVIVDSLAASAASFIAQAGDTIAMTRNATMMIHDGSGMVYGNAKDMHDMGNLLDKLSDNIADIYSQRAGGTQETWRNFMREEVWYNADEAVEAKLADTVLSYSDDTAEEAKNSWSLALFNHAGRGDAPSPNEIRSKLALTNSVKETPVTGKANPPKNTEPGGAPAPDGGELAPAGGDGNEPPANDPSTPAPPVVEPPVVEPEAVPAPEPVVNKATGAITFTIGGIATADPKAVQQHINVLETAADESKKAARRTFVQNLATPAGGNKISASQIDELEELALDLSDKQWEKWTAAYDKAPALSLLEKHGGVPTTPQDVNTAQATADRIEVLEQIIVRHKQGGMHENAIAKTPSYLELQQLKSASSTS